MTQDEIEHLLSVCKNAHDKVGFAMSELTAARHKLERAEDDCRAAHTAIGVLKDNLVRAHRGVRGNPKVRKPR